jgi:hypothetical protein
MQASSDHCPPSPSSSSSSSSITIIASPPPAYSSNHLPSKLKSLFKFNNTSDPSVSNRAFCSPSFSGRYAHTLSFFFYLPAHTYLYPRPVWSALTYEQLWKVNKQPASQPGLSSVEMK